VFISLADGSHGPYRESLRQLSINAWVTNRDLPVLLPQGAGGGTKAWRLDTPGPVSAVHCMRGPTRPVSRQPAGRAGWQLVAQITRHQIALGDDPVANAAALRELLTLHGPQNDVAWAHQAEGLRSLQARPVVRRLPFKGPLSFGNGVELELEVDEQAFQGASAFLLASVIETLLARQAAINSFTQLTLVSAQRGQVMRWPPRIGLRPML
jgi:type VI secretion system protein ImpG